MILGDIVDLVIVGSIGYDDIQTPYGKVSSLLGGSASYSGLSAAFHARDMGLERVRVGLVSIIGSDFDEISRRRIVDAGLDIDGVRQSNGRTFRWSGRYEGSMDHAITVSTELNVLSDFKPTLPLTWRDPPILFCSSASPATQIEVLNHNKGSKITALDTFQLWIDTEFQGLCEALRKVDIAIFNEDEVNSIGTGSNYLESGRNIMTGQSLDGGELVGSGPQILVIKRGSAGCVCIHRRPKPSGYPTESVVDPTDVEMFCRCILYNLFPMKEISQISNYPKSVDTRYVTASFNIESFGSDSISTLKRGKYRARLDHYRRM